MGLDKEELEALKQKFYEEITQPEKRFQVIFKNPDASPMIVMGRSLEDAVNRMCDRPSEMLKIRDVVALPDEWALERQWELLKTLSYDDAILNALVHAIGQGINREQALLGTVLAQYDFLREMQQRLQKLTEERPVVSGLKIP